MFNRYLASQALQMATIKRKEISQDYWLPFCIYDVLENQNIEIRFIETPSIEGIYSMNPGPLILIGSERPKGRQAYTCAHEYGHHSFEHGYCVDELNSAKKYDEKEILADLFAGYFLMPKTVVLRAINRRGLEIGTMTPLQVFSIACNLGVGYSTIVNHLFKSLNLISKQHYSLLIEKSVKQIKQTVLGYDFTNEIVLLDNYWEGRPVDLSAGELLVTSNEVLVSSFDHYESIRNNYHIYRFDSPGIYTLTKNNGDSIFIRVSRMSYCGLNRYKHLEE